VKRLAGLIAAFALAGAGCVPILPTPTPDQAAASIDAKPGLRLTIDESAFGFGGALLGALGQSSTRSVTIDAWDGKKASVSWEKSFEQETAASVKARAAFDALPPTPVGQPAPTPPKKETETVTLKGTVATDALADGTSLLLPTAWTQGDEPAQAGKTLLWLSKAQYQQLVDTRKAKIDLGLFDSDLSGAMSAVQGFQTFLDWVNHKQSDPAQRQPLDVMSADENWGSYALTVDGVSQTVRTVEAGNAFARISVLANPDDPLVLQVRVTPAAYGPDALLAPASAFAKALGYEVTEIKTAP
jgi:hypothetical protein